MPQSTITKLVPQRHTGPTLLALTACLAASILTCAKAEAATYILNARVYCGQRLGAPCLVGTTSFTRQDVERALQSKVRHMMDVYRPAGITFQLDVEVIQDNRLAGFRGLSDVFVNGNEVEGKTQLFMDLENLALSQLDRMTVIATEGLVGASWSGWDAAAVFAEFPIGNGLFEESLYSHELGHYLGLRHTTTFADGVGADHNAGVGHNATTNCTAPDPGEVEYDGDINIDSDGDGDPNEGDMADGTIKRMPTTLRENHFYCEQGDLLIDNDRYALNAVTAFTPTDLGSGRARALADPRCWERATGMAPSRMTPSDQIWTNVMSYYFSGQGPYALGGVEFPAIQSCQVDVITRLLANERSALVDVCASRGGDTDLDGKCDQDDPCPTTFNPFDEDNDGDGQESACDLCDRDDSVLADLDGDGVAGLCDNDEDGDGCYDDASAAQAAGQPGGPIDLKPDSAETTLSGYDCTATFSDAEDHDEDGVLACADADDYAMTVLCIGDIDEEVAFCPYCPIVWEDRIGVRIYPEFGDPFEFSNVRRYGSKLSFGPQPGEVPSITHARLFAALKTSQSMNFTAVNQGVWLEFFDTTNETVFSQMQLPDVQADQFTSGTYVTLELRPGQPSLVYRSFGRAGQSALEMPDADRDGMPDEADNCIYRWNPSQFDADRDLIGDACDPDLNNDGRVNWQDGLKILGCLHHRVHDPGGSRPSVEGRYFMPADAAVIACNPADLNGDGVVTFWGDYVLRFLPLWGQSPGPSAFIKK